MIVYVSVGNVNDGLSQKRYYGLLTKVGLLLRRNATVYAEWYTSPLSPSESACWYIDIPMEVVEKVKERLRELAEEFEQRAIMWAATPIVTHLAPPL